MIKNALTPARQPAAAPEARQPEETDSPLILVAEDNPFNQQVVATLLKKAGFRTMIVDNGKKAIEHVQESPVDLILMDCHMPVMDGWEATREIRRLEADGALASGGPAHLPIIAATAGTRDESSGECTAAGMDDFVTKPIVYEKLLEAIAENLGADSSTEAAAAREAHSPLDADRKPSTSPEN